MTTKTRLQQILQYFQGNRRSGSTTAMIKGAENTPGLVVLAADANHVEYLRYLLPKFMTVVSYASDLRRLAGMKAPMVLDNHAVCTLIQDALFGIDKLEHDLAEEQNARKKAQDQVNFEQQQLLLVGAGKAPSPLRNQRDELFGMLILCEGWLATVPGGRKMQLVCQEALSKVKEAMD